MAEFSAPAFARAGDVAGQIDLRSGWICLGPGQGRAVSCRGGTRRWPARTGP